MEHYEVMLALNEKGADQSMLMTDVGSCAMARMPILEEEGVLNYEVDVVEVAEMTSLDFLIWEANHETKDEGEDSWWKMEVLNKCQSTAYPSKIRRTAVILKHV